MSLYIISYNFIRVKIITEPYGYSLLEQECVYLLNTYNKAISKYDTVVY